MLKVTSPITAADFERAVYNKLHTDAKTAIEKVLKNTDPKYVKRASSKFLVVSILLFLTILLFLIGLVIYIMHKNAKNYLTALIIKEIDNHKIYNDLFKELDPNFNTASLERGHYSTNMKNLSVALNYIPKQAKAIEHSPTLKVNFSNSNINYSTNLFKWYEKNSKNNSEIYLQEIGMLEMKTDDAKLENFNFSYFTNSLGLQKIKTENKAFNKNFKLRSNDELKSRMLATPFSMEELLKHHSKNVLSKKVSVMKQGNLFTIIFEPYAPKSLTLDFNYNENVEIMARLIIQDFILDTYQIYALMCYILIPPLLDR